MTTINAVPDPVENLALDRSELEILARYYFNVRLDYEYDRFAYDDLGMGISTGEWWEYVQARCRLEAIEAVLAPEKMAALKKAVESDARRKVGEKNWAEFTGHCGYENKFLNEPLCGAPATRIVEIAHPDNGLWIRHPVCDRHYQKYAELSTGPSLNHRNRIRLTEETFGVERAE